MLEGRTVAVVGASERAGLLRLADGDRGAAQPRHRAVLAGQPAQRHACSASPACRRWPTYRSRSTWCCSAYPTTRSLDQVRLASARGDGGAVVFGSAYGLREELVAAADGPRDLRRRLHGLRQRGPRGARDRLPRAGPGAGRPDRAGDPLGLGVLGDAAHPPPAGVLRSRSRPARSWSRRPPTTSPTPSRSARDPGRSGWCSRPCATRPACARAWPTPPSATSPSSRLTVGGSARGQALVDAHSGAIAGLGRRLGGAVRGVRRAPGRRPRRAGRQPGVLRDRPAGTPAGRRHRDRPRLRGGAGAGGRRGRAARRPVRAAVGGDDRPAGRAARPGPGAHQPARRLGHRQRRRGPAVGDCLAALADDDAVDVVALAVDLVPEFDGDESFPKALGRLVDHTDKPVAVLSNLSSAIDEPLAAQLRARGIPVLEGTRSGPAGARSPARPGDTRRTGPTPAVDEERRARWVGAVRGRRRRPVRAAGRLRDPGRAHSWKVDEARVGGRGGGDARLPGRAQDRRPRTSTTSSTSTASGSGSATRPPCARRTRARRPARADGRRPAAGAAGRRGGPRHLARPAARTARAGRGRRLARGAAGGALGRAAAGRRRHRPGAGRPAAPVGAARRPPRPPAAGPPTAWSPRWSRSRSWRTSSATCSRRST